MKMLRIFLQEICSYSWMRFEFFSYKRFTEQLLADINIFIIIGAFSENFSDFIRYWHHCSLVKTLIFFPVLEFRLIKQGSNLEKLWFARREIPKNLDVKQKMRDFYKNLQILEKILKNSTIFSPIDLEEIFLQIIPNYYSDIPS